ncbi:MAG: outer membrane beta-barrel protein, partial [Terriglobia bacterium]
MKKGHYEIPRRLRLLGMTGRVSFFSDLLDLARYGEGVTIMTKGLLCATSAVLLVVMWIGLPAVRLMADGNALGADNVTKPDPAAQSSTQVQQLDVIKKPEARAAHSAGAPGLVSAVSDADVQPPTLATFDSSEDPQTQTTSPPATAAAPSPAPQATAPAAPQPLAMPSMTAPLSTAVPHTFNAGPFGNLAITGIISGMGLVQGNWIPGDRSTHWDLSNGQVFIQKTTGWWQFYLQAGAYNLPALGTPFLSTVDTVSDLYGPLPQGYLKLAPKGNFSVMIGALPTLIGAEYTFTFENMNIERGLLWNQENAVNRGVQINDSKGKLSGS